jgi:molecular chaperone HtpG
MKKGNIGVQAENIFPIIKKFLYSDHEIFLRELVSNAVDATQKLKTLSGVGEYKGDVEDLKVEVKVDKDAKTITISDNGIGMTEDEIEKYINQIAFSGAEEFLDKYKNDANAIIGHFGLGFYSSFMVSERVDIVTKSHKDGAQAVKWSCDGSPDYTLEEISKDRVGTDIVLHIDSENESFLEDAKINELLNKYCKFLPVEVAYGKKKEWKDGQQVDTDEQNIVNTTNPVWTRKPADINEEEYSEFYRSLYPMADDPIFNIHLNVDYPFNLTGVLYFPKVKATVELQRNKIQLYCNQVFVTDSVENIVPEFLTLLHGVIDSPDIPLNVSRSYLQSDHNVKKISNHITKKVADKLEELFKADRKKFEEIWEDLKIFVQYGMLSEEKFYERAKKFYLLKNTEGKFYTLEEYETLVKETQTDKDGNLIYLYASNTVDQHSYIAEAKRKEYDVLVIDSPLAAHFINKLEQADQKKRFVRVDADVVEKLIQKEDSTESKLSINEQNDFRPVFENQLPKDANYMVNFESLGADANPVMITQNEFMRRMKDMQATSGQNMNIYGSMPDSYNIIVNTDHKLVTDILGDKKEKLGTELDSINSKISSIEAKKTEINKDKKEEDLTQEEKDEVKSITDKVDSLSQEKRKKLENFGNENKKVKQLIDLALLSNNMLKGEALSDFVKRSIELM